MEWRSSFCAGTGTDTLFNSFSLKNVSSVFSACVGKKDSNPSKYFYKDKVPYVRLNSQGSEEDIPYTNHSQPMANYKSSLISKMESLNSATSELMRKDRWGTLMAPQIIGGFVGTKSLSGREQPFSVGVFSAPVNFNVIEVAQTLVNTMHSGNFDCKSNLNINRSNNNEAHSDCNKECNASVMSDCGQKNSEKSLSTGEQQIANQHSSFESAEQKEAVLTKDECSEVQTYASVASKPCSQNHDNLSARMQSSQTSDQSSSKMATEPKSRHFNNKNCVDRKSRGYSRQKGFSKNSRYVATENKPTANKKYLYGNLISESKKQNQTNIPINNFAHKSCEKPYRKLNAKKHSEMKFMKQDKAAIQDLCNSNSTLQLVSEAQNIACDINLRNRHLTLNKLDDTCKTNVNRNMAENSKPRKKRRRRRKRRPKTCDERTNGKSQLDDKLASDDYEMLKKKTDTKQECSESVVKGTSNSLEMDCLALKLSITPPICTNATIAFILGICSDVDTQDTESDSDSFQDDYEENERLWQLFQKSGSKISLPTDEVDSIQVIKPEATNSKEIDTVDSSEKPSLIKCNDFKELDIIENVSEDEDVVIGPSVTSQLHEVNCNWNKDIEKPVSPRRCKDPSKKVHFAEGKTLCQVKNLVAWAYAYQAARKGDWENYARDRERFALRIKDVEKCISKVLDPVHRKRIYQKFICGKEGS